MPFTILCLSVSREVLCWTIGLQSCSGSWREAHEFFTTHSPHNDRMDERFYLADNVHGGLLEGHCKAVANVVSLQGLC